MIHLTNSAIYAQLIQPSLIKFPACVNICLANILKFFSKNNTYIIVIYIIIKINNEYNMSLNAQKNKLRARLKRLRSDISSSSRQQKNLAIASKILAMSEVKQAHSIFCFVSFGTEVDTHALIDDFSRQNKDIAIPRIIESEHMLSVKFHSWAELTVGQLGIPTPPAESLPIDKFDITLTPGLGFSETGQRLGFGRGYYDLWFKNHDSGLKIALCYETQIQKELPSNENDVAVDINVSEERIIRL
jgi:5-formyltetrahydrofolate cyclo-ligase